LESVDTRWPIFRLIDWGLRPGPVSVVLERIGGGELRATSHRLKTSASSGRTTRASWSRTAPRLVRTPSEPIPTGATSGVQAGTEADRGRGAQTGAASSTRGPVYGTATACWTDRAGRAICCFQRPTACDRNRSATTGSGRAFRDPHAGLGGRGSSSRASSRREFARSARKAWAALIGRRIRACC